MRLTYERLTDGKHTWQISLTLDIHRKGDAFEATGEIENHAEGWMVCGFTGPTFSGIQADLATHPILLPNGFGRRIDGVPTGKGIPAPWRAAGELFEITAQYPSYGGTMQWCAFAGAQGGFYLGCHDSDRCAKTFSVRYNPKKQRFGLAIRQEFFCAAGNRWALPPVVFTPYEGDWRAAARRYRDWSDSAMTPLDPPAWVKNSSGWLLCILKQQNGEIMWDYPSLQKLCDVADRRGLDILGLFGWAHGGHDHLYPDYFPDPKLGGKEALRKSLKEVRRRGKRSILYANGQLIERDTDFWNAQGKKLTMVQRDGKPVLNTYHKYKNIPIYQFNLACLSAQGWRDRLLALARQADDLGADGILFDQLGCMGPMACYAEGHEHPAPSMVYAAERASLLRHIAAQMKKINPDFVVITEGLHDSVLDSTSFFHGCAFGAFQADIRSTLDRDSISVAFPDMFRYTFPEAISTVRVSTPMVNRIMANYACVYGLRYEIESRYTPDVRYLLEDRIPDLKEYEQVVSQPDLRIMREKPPAEANRYLKRMIDFRRANADLLWRGRFVGDEGFTFSGRGLIAKSYVAGDRLGVVVWNPSDKAATFTLDVPDADFISASEPEKGKPEAFAELPPQSVRLLIWKKRRP